MKTIFLFLYQGFLMVTGPLFLLARWIRGKPVPGLRQRPALYPPEQRKALSFSERPIWIHMVSVGEVLAGQHLIEELRRRLPRSPWVITTVTPTGQSVARALIRGSQDQLLYLPWDLGSVVRRAIRAIRPRFFICFETELWPVLFHELGKAGVPIAIVNGRISPKSFHRYLLARLFMQKALLPVKRFLVQSPQDARRYAAIGAAKDRIVVTGNVKWDLGSLEEMNGQGRPDARSLLGLAPGALLWTAGSTHPGEERLILQVYQRLKADYPHLRLLIAPRHPERVAEVEQEVKSFELTAVRRSELGKKNGEGSVILLDTLGELKSFYGASELVFVGGSLVPRGGHNLVEPALFSRPILTGPHLYNFQDMAEALSQAGGVAIVRSVEELEERARRLLENPALRQELGERAYGAILQHRGATAKTADLLLQCLGGERG